MNKIAALVSLAGLAMVATVANAQTYNFNGTPIGIPDATPAGISIQTDPITASGVIGSVTASIEMNPRHTWMSDVSVSLGYTPTGGSETRVFLFNRVGGSNDLFGIYNFTDTATVTIAGTGSVYTAGVLNPGDYRASSALNVPVSLNTSFGGLPMSGTWTLYAADFVGFDTGTINAASVTVTSASAPIPPRITGNTTGIIRGGPTGNPPYRVLITGTVAAGANPASTGLVARADLSALGGSATQQLFDDGTNGDAVAGDGIYSYLVDVTNTTTIPAGSYTIPLTVRDNQNRTGTATSSVTLTDATAVALGTVSGTNTFISGSNDVPSGGVAWYTFTSNINTNVSGYVDIFTDSSSAVNDTMLALYKADGTFIAFNDDTAGNLKSLLSYGATGTPRTHPGMTATATGNSTNAAGTAGNLDAGNYVLAVVAYGFPYTFTTPFVATSTGTAAGTVPVNIYGADVSPPSPIVATGNSVTPAAMSLGGGPGGGASTVTDALLTFTFTPGGNPASSGLSVQANLSPLGLGTVQMYDDGTNGDLSAGDGTYSVTITAAQITTAGAGNYNLVTSVSDAQGRTATRTSVLRVSPVVTVNDVGTLAFPQAPINYNNAITGREVNWIKFTLANDLVAGGSQYLDIDTNGSSMDTHIGLYDNAGNFLGISDDDDGAGLQSALSFGSTDPTGRDTNAAGIANNGRDGGLSAGTYYLALNFFVATYGANYAASTTNAGTGGTYIVNIYTGQAGVVPSACLADINLDGVVDGTDFVLFINSFALGDVTVDAAADVAGGNTGNTPDPDGTIDGNDFVAFINAFALGC